MRFTRGLDWFDLLIVGIAAAIVYPDKLLRWLAGRIGRTYTRTNLLWLEAGLLGVLVCLMAILMPHFPRLDWWQPVVPICLFAAFRFVRALVMDVLGIKDE